MFQPKLHVGSMTLGGRPDPAPGLCCRPLAKPFVANGYMHMDGQNHSRIIAHLHVQMCHKCMCVHRSNFLLP